MRSVVLGQCGWLGLHPSLPSPSSLPHPGPHQLLGTRLLLLYRARASDGGNKAFQEVEKAGGIDWTGNTMEMLIGDSDPAFMFY